MCFKLIYIFFTIVLHVQQYIIYTTKSVHMYEQEQVEKK
jgi:hypothetical protein